MRLAMRQGADKRSRDADPRMLAKPVHDRGSMRGLFHRASLLCFYRTSGPSIHKYNSSIAPIDSWHAVNTHPPCPGVPNISLTTALPYWSRLSNCLPFPSLSQRPWPVDRAPSHPTNRCVRILRWVLYGLRGRILTITSVQTYQQHHRQGKDQERSRQFYYPSSLLPTVSAPRRTRV